MERVLRENIKLELVPSFCQILQQVQRGLCKTLTELSMLHFSLGHDPLVCLV